MYNHKEKYTNKIIFSVLVRWDLRPRCARSVWKMFVTLAHAEMGAVVISHPWIDTPVAALLDGKVSLI